MKQIIQEKLADAVGMELPELIQREFRVPAIPNKVFAIIGMRRTGKTYFLYQIMKKCLEAGIERSRLVYFSFEDERLGDMTVQNLHLVLDEYYVMFPENRSQKVWFLFDEIQLVEGWETFVRRMLDSENVEICISGSSAKMLSKEIASSMRGRSVDVTVYPYSFAEFLKNGKITHSSLLKINKQQKSILENQLLQYLVTGGFPEAQGLSSRDRRILLQGYVNTVIFRDIVERYNISNISVLKKLIRYAIRNTACLFTVNKFYNHLKSQGIKASKNTLHNYLDYIEDAFLLNAIPIYSQSARKQMVNPQKIYIADPGLCEAYFLTQGSPNTGRLLENCIFTELLRRGAKIFYLKTPSGYEIDFAAFFPNGSVYAIQVAADISEPETREREIRALCQAPQILPDASLMLITLSEHLEILRDNLAISIIPAWRWLLDRNI